MSQPIHQAESDVFPPACANHNGQTGVIGPQLGRCNNDYVGPSYNEVECTVDGCSAVGKMRCSNGSYPVHPSFTLDCSTKVINNQYELPRIVVQQDLAECHWSDGSAIMLQCAGDGSIRTDTFP